MATDKKSTTQKGSNRRSAPKGPRPVFRASQELADNLQQVHVDLIELHVQGKQAHWNVVGKNFRDLHLQLDEIIEAARLFSDKIAERMRATYVTPDGRSSTVAERTTLTDYPAGEVDTADTVELVSTRLYAVVDSMREVHDQVDEEDPTTADLLHGMIEKLEQFAWMVSSENRIANVTDLAPLHE